MILYLNFFLRISGLHSFCKPGFQQMKQNYALFVIHKGDQNDKWRTAGAALPSKYFEKVGLMNTQACQVKIKDRNYLYIAGGYGYCAEIKGMFTFPQVCCAYMLGDQIEVTPPLTLSTGIDCSSFAWLKNMERNHLWGSQT